MRFLHLADLHIGRRLNEYSLIDEQKKTLEQAAETIKEQDCDAVLIAGDIYDKPSPAAEAMELFDFFVSRICEMGKKIWMISGNHDSAGRVSYLSHIIKNSGVYAPEQFSGVIQSFDTDENITVHLMPFLKPSAVRGFYPDIEIKSYDDAVRTVIENSRIDKSRINILVCHQFITGGEICESEEFAVGGLDNVSAEIFRDFDYVALGHLHRAQKCGRDTVRYAGSPLKYSLSEENHKKTFTIVDVKEKGNIEISEIPIKLPKDIKTVKGEFEELRNMEYTEDYIRVILTDEVVPPDAFIRLRMVFPYMIRFSVENSKTGYEEYADIQKKADSRTPIELFMDFYALQNGGVYPDEEQLKLAAEIFEQLREEE